MGPPAPKTPAPMGMDEGPSVPASSPLEQFIAHDAKRRLRGGPSTLADSTADRELEGRLMAELMGPAAPLATVPVGLAGAGYEGLKALAQKTGLGKHLPGPFQVDESTSPASIENVLALLKGFTSP